MSLRKIRQDLGLNPKAITSGIELPEIATIEQLNAIRDQGIAEMDRDGHSQAYLVWSEALRRGMDQSLPSIHEMTGLVTDEESVLQETLAAAKSSKQSFDPERLDPRLAELSFEGVPIVDRDAHDVLNFLHGAMAEEASDSGRARIMELISAVHNSPFGDTTSTVSINTPDPLQTFEVASEQESTGDWYTDQRNAAMRPPQGLEGLAIGDGFGLDGYKGLGGGGGQYSPAHDMGLQQAIAAGYYEDDDDE